jgi:hypothetical protein
MEATTPIPHGNKLNVIITTLSDTDKKISVAEYLVATTIA